MDSYRKFDSIEEMFDYIEKQTQRANASLTAEQKAITWGSHWVRFLPSEQLIIFGRVFTLAEIEQGERSAGASTEELEYTLNSCRANHDRGYLFGRAYSVAEPDGELGDTHRANMWPITEQQFDEARQAAWNPSRIVPGMFSWLAEAYSHYRAYLLSIPQE